MNFRTKMPTEIIYETNCVRANAKKISSFGDKIFIVTGKYSAKRSGALADLIAVCEMESLEYQIFDEIENNPSLETVIKGAQSASAFEAKLIIGIGGGSPLDAAKAIAVLTIEGMDPVQLFKNEFKQSLPVIAIPTTAGTGSEVTPYSVLVRKDIQTKMSFGNEITFPKLALLDAKYTESLNKNTTKHTAIDAFTHVFEGYVCNRATVFTDALAIDAIRIFGECLDALIEDRVTEEIRSKLMYVSVMGGLVITHTGVTIAHGMGYCYTYFHDMPHGLANGLLMPEVIATIYPYKKKKVEHVIKVLKCKSIQEFIEKLEKLLGKRPELTMEQIKKYTELTLLQKGSIANTPGDIDEDKIFKIWEKVGAIA